MQRKESFGKIENSQIGINHRLLLKFSLKLFKNYFIKIILYILGIRKTVCVRARARARCVFVCLGVKIWGAYGYTHKYLYTTSHKYHSLQIFIKIRYKKYPEEEGRS